MICGPRRCIVDFLGDLYVLITEIYRYSTRNFKSRSYKRDCLSDGKTYVGMYLLTYLPIYKVLQKYSDIFQIE